MNFEAKIIGQEEENIGRSKKKEVYLNQGEAASKDDFHADEQQLTKDAENLRVVREKLSNIGATSEMGKESANEKEKLMEFRFNQSMASRLAEYITGIRPDDPKMIDRLIEDQKTIRAKYHLPEENMRFENPSEYERKLREMAKRSETGIRDKSERSRFFEEFPLADGVHMEEEKSVFVGLNRNSQELYSTGLGSFEHELIHAEQNLTQKRMPIELQEYEAYIAGLNSEFIKKHPEEIEPIIFDFFIGGSVNIWYEEQNKIAESRSLPKIKPIWDDPEFFLKNVDNVSQADIDEYKKRNAMESEN